MNNNNKGQIEHDAFINSLKAYVHEENSDISKVIETRKQIKAEIDNLYSLIEPNIEQFYFFTQKIRETYKADNLDAIEKTKQYCLEMIEKATETRLAFLKGGWILKSYVDNIKNGSQLSPDDNSEALAKIELDLLHSQIRAVTNLPIRILPEHIGYQKICIILEKEGEYSQALHFANKAAQEGWRPEWSSRIEKLKKKIGNK